jgi:hypothetical protein
MQLAITETTRFIRVIALEDDRGLVATLGQMPIEAIGGDVEPAILVPTDVQILRVEGNVLDLLRRPDPVQPRRDLGPEAFRVADGCIMETPVVVLADARLGGECGFDRMKLGHGEAPANDIARMTRTRMANECSRVRAGSPRGYRLWSRLDHRRIDRRDAA